MAKSDTQAGEGVLRRISVLVADDDPQDRALLQMAAETAELELLIAQNRDELWRLLELAWSQGTLPDAILTDLHMPGMDLATMLARLRNTAEFSKIPLVVMSNSGALRSHEQELVERIGRFEQKPVSFDGLEDMLHRLRAELTQ